MKTDPEEFEEEYAEEEYIGGTCEDAPCCGCCGGEDSWLDAAYEDRYDTGYEPEWEY